MPSFIPPPVLRALLRLSIALLFIALIVPAGRAVDWGQPTLLTETGLTQFGAPLARHGSRMAVGARLDFQTRQLRIYDWVDQAWVAASPGLTNDAQTAFENFPDALALNAALVVASSQLREVNGNNQQGAVYTFTEQAGAGIWTQEPPLLAPDGMAGDNFGSALALDGDLLVVGAKGVDDDLSMMRGAAYVYRRVDGVWNFLEKLTPPQDDVLSFGNAVAISGGHIAVGTSNWIGALSAQGAVYLYRYDGQSITPAGRFMGQDDNAFGASLALDGDWLSVGIANQDFEGKNNQGLVQNYRFDGRRWVAAGVVRATDGEAGDFFGSSLALDVADGLLIVGARGVDGALNNQGAIYVYALTGTRWTQIDRFVNSALPQNAALGRHLAMHDASIVAATPGIAIDENPSQGAVFTYVPQLLPPQNLVATADGETAITLSWSPAAGALSYQLERAVGGSTVWTAVAADIAGTAHTDPDLICNTQYVYRVRAVNAVTTSLPSGVASATTALCSEELLTQNHGGFEGGGLAALGWTRQKPTNDKIFCNNPQKNRFVAHQGDCAFRFIGSPSEDSRLTRFIALEAGAIGADDLVTLSAWVDGRKPSTVLRVTLRAHYTDDTRDNRSFVVRRKTAGYEFFTVQLALTRPVSQLQVLIFHRSKSGATFIDTMRVAVVRQGDGPEMLRGVRR